VVDFGGEEAGRVLILQVRSDRDLRAPDRDRVLRGQRGEVTVPDLAAQALIALVMTFRAAAGLGNAARRSVFRFRASGLEQIGAREQTEAAHEQEQDETSKEGP
jgi:hypothetical protein